MNPRRNLIRVTVYVLLMVALAAPLAYMLSRGAQEAFDQKQAAIARALEMEVERKERYSICKVMPVMDIEKIWDIEDSREQTDRQLVLGMTGGTGEMGYDAESSTFYCTLGLDNGDDWPEIDLNARTEEDVQVVWIDDYSYDWCSDAVAQNYRYELLAYTDTQYAYLGIVFTGLPIVTLHAEGEIGLDDESAGWMTVAAAGHEPVDTSIVIHERGGRHLKPIDKPAYRVEMHMLGHNGKAQRRETSLLGMKPDSEWLLLSNAQDESTVRNKILFDLWKDWHGNENALMTMASELVEVFEGDKYMGIYQLMERVRPEEEIAAIGGDVYTDCTVRGIAEKNLSDKPVWNLNDKGIDFCFEYRYEHSENAERAFMLTQDYVTLNLMETEQRLNDDDFVELVLERVDIEDMMNYILFYHSCTLQDNSTNNIYLYIMRQEDGRYIYRHAPWDMDLGLWVSKNYESHNSLRWPDISMVLPARMLELNAGGCREMLWKLWNEKRSTVLSKEAFSVRIKGMEEYVNASGAYLRESEKWYGEAMQLNLSEMKYYAEECLNLVRITMESLWPVDNMTLLE